MATIPGIRSICIVTRYPARAARNIRLFCPAVVQPLEMHGRSDNRNPLRVIRWSCNAYIAHYYAAAAHNLRTAFLEHSTHGQLICRLTIAPTYPPVSQACGRFSVSSKSCYSIITPPGLMPPRINLYRATNGRDDATHPPPATPRNIRRNRQAQQAPAGHTPPPNAQQSGRGHVII